MRHRPRRSRSSTGAVTPLRRTLREALSAIAGAVDEWIADDGLPALAEAVHELRRDVTLAIVVLEETDRDTAMVDASRGAAIRAALRVNAALGAAYQDRWAPPRPVLAACYAVARVIEALQMPPSLEPPRWN